MAERKSISVALLGWSRSLTLMEAWKRLDVTPSHGSHSVGDMYTRGRTQCNYDHTLLRVESGEPESSSLEVHLEKLTAKMREAKKKYRELFDEVTVQITCLTSYVATEIELNKNCIDLVNHLGVGLTFSFSECMDVSDENDS